jgi:hypothetical protein
MLCYNAASLVCSPVSRVGVYMIVFVFISQVLRTSSAAAEGRKHVWPALCKILSHAFFIKETRVLEVSVNNLLGLCKWSLYLMLYCGRYNLCGTFNDILPHMITKFRHIELYAHSRTATTAESSVVLVFFKTPANFSFGIRLSRFNRNPCPYRSLNFGHCIVVRY